MISIIIPTYNRVDTLELVLPSYFIQKEVGEIIIVDDNSLDNYAPLIDKARKKYSIPLIYIKNQNNLGAAGSRNVGLKIAKYDMILWGEDDAFLDSKYTEILLKHVNPKGNTAICGAIHYGLLPYYTNEQMQSIIEEQIKTASNKKLFDFNFFEGCYQKNVKELCEIPFGHALLLAPRSFYDNVTYFEGYKVNGFREESDAQIQMLKNGNHIFYTSETCCYHFPGNFNKKGGQHNNLRLTYEIYKIINNAIFMKRHYNYLKKRFSLHGTVVTKSVSFAFYTIHNDFCIIFKKIKNKVETFKGE